MTHLDNKALFSGRDSSVLLVLPALAIALPLLWPTPTVPDAVFANQLAAVALWSLLIFLRPPAGNLQRNGRCAAAAVSAALLLCAAFALPRLEGGHAATVLVLCLAVAVLQYGARAGVAGQIGAAWGWWAVGLLSTFVAGVQYFAPDGTDGVLVAATTSVGRAVGNMRQPNHLAAALVCSMVMTAWLAQSGRLRVRWAAASVLAMVVALGLTGSRTGALLLVLLLAWAVWDRTLPVRLRWMLGLTPLTYLLAWLALHAWATAAEASFYGSSRLQGGADLSGLRFAIWDNTLTLIAQQPWTGVGWGRFNLAWTFTPFAERPPQFFDHAHNLPLHLAAEMGVPATAVVVGLVLWALWRAWPARDASAARAGLVLLAALGVHSLLEYPLWYAYFLLPAAWTLGTLCGAVQYRGGEPEPAEVRESSVRAAAGWRMLGLAGLALAAFAAWDHRRVEAIFAPGPGAAPLQVRIAEARRSWLFGHHADYAAATTRAVMPRDADASMSLEVFRRPLQRLIDVRLMTAYAEALHARGDTAQAHYVLQRLREFDRDDAQAYFSDCGAAESADWHCAAGEPISGLRWSELLPAQ